MDEIESKFSYCNVCKSRLDLICNRCFEIHFDKAKTDINALLEERENEQKKAEDLYTLSLPKLKNRVQFELKQKEAEDLKEKLLNLSTQVANERIKVAALAFEIQNIEQFIAENKKVLSDHQSKQNSIDLLIEKGLNWYSKVQLSLIRQRKYEQVLQMFILIPIEIPACYMERKKHGKSSDARKEEIGGVGVISGLPLLNDGTYDSVPAEVLSSALFMVARLVEKVSECLEYRIPHPLHTDGIRTYASISSCEIGTDNCEDYLLHPPKKEQNFVITKTNFETAIDLLRRDVIVLCVQGGGVPIQRLWPAEAILLNLWELHFHIASELQSMERKAMLMPEYQDDDLVLDQDYFTTDSLDENYMNKIR